MDTTGLSPDTVAALNSLPGDITDPTTSWGQQIADAFKSYEQARLANAATSAQVNQIAMFGNINPAWILAGVFVIFLALARR